MKQILTLLILMICSIGYSQTQFEMNESAKESYAKADKELNVVYKKLLTDNKTDTVFIKNLNAAQRIWITFRDSEVKVKFPEREPGFYGSMLPMCISMFLEQLTKDRTATLKKYLDGKDDNCN